MRFLVITALGPVHIKLRLGERIVLATLTKTCAGRGPALIKSLSHLPSAGSHMRFKIPLIAWHVRPGKVITVWTRQVWRAPITIA
jgi:hypothetical protein